MIEAACLPEAGLQDSRSIRPLLPIFMSFYIITTSHDSKNVAVFIDYYHDACYYVMNHGYVLNICQAVITSESLSHASVITVMMDRSWTHHD